MPVDPKTRVNTRHALPGPTGLALLLAEMQALAALLPGSRTAPLTDAEIEATFDNMPV